MKTRRETKNSENKGKNNEYRREYIRTTCATKNAETKEKNNEYINE